MEEEKKADDLGSQPAAEHETTVNYSIPQIVKHFKLLNGDNAPGWLNIWTFPDKKSHYFNPNDMENIVRVCEELRQSQDVYFGLALRKDNLGTWQRGEAESVNAVFGLWLDVDCKGGVHKASNLPTFKEASTLILDTFELKPSTLVNSGGGLHVYWVFDQLFIIDNEEDRERAQALLIRFQQLFIQTAHACGWKLDNTSNIAQVLRVPGTYNRKGGKQTLVKIEGSDGDRRYTLEEIESAIINAEVKLTSIRESNLETAAGPLAVPNKTYRHETDERKASASLILNKCNFMKHCADDAASLTEPEWYKMVSIIGRTDMGEDLCHDLSRPHSGYSEEETDKKIKHAIEASGPFTCERIQFDHGDEWCRGCQSNRKIKSPIQLGFDRIGTAKKTVSEAIQRATNGDVGAPLELQVVGALALIESLDPAEYARMKTELKKAKVPLTEVNKLVRKERQRERLRVVSPGEAAPKRTAGDFLDDCPFPNLIVPDTYLINDDGMYRRHVRNEGRDNQTTTQILVAHEPVIIAGLYRDINTSREALRVSWKKNDRWFYEIVDRGILANNRSIINLADQGFPVNSANANELVSYLSELESINIKHKTLPVAWVTNQMGWQSKDGSKGFLWGKTLVTPQSEVIHDLSLEDVEPGEWKDDLISFRGSDVGDEQLVEGFHSKGSMEKWLETVEIASKYPKVMLGFYAAFVAPMLRILDCDSFILEYARKTSKGKSIAQRFAGSTMGNPDNRSHDSVVQSWGVKPAWLGRAASVISGLPLILDDTKNAKNKEFVANAIYMITTGRDLGRGTVKGLGMTRTFRTVLISSGEVVCTSFTPDAGTKGRVLAITSLPFDGDGPDERVVVEKLDRLIKNNYGHAMPLFLQWIMKQKDNWDMFKTKFEELTDKYSEQALDSVTGRLAKYAAAIDITSTLVYAAFQDAGQPLPFDYEDPFRDGLYEQIMLEAKDASGEEEALKDVLTWAASNETSFYGRHQLDPNGEKKRPHNGVWFGQWDRGENWECINFNRYSLYSFIQSIGKNPEELFKHWKENGWLDVPAYDRGFQKKVSIEGIKLPHISIKREAFDQL